MHRLILAVSSALVLLASPIVAQTNPVQLSYGAFDTTAGTLDVYMSNTVEVAGFQFTMSDLGGSPVVCSTGSGGTAGTAGMVVMGGPTGVVLGFSIAAGKIPPSGGVHQLLTTLLITGVPTSVCMSAVVVSDPAAMAVATDVGPCVSIPPVDCNGNGIDDGTDLFQGTSLDLDGDLVPDDCQLLSAAPASISVAAGGTQTFTLNAGPTYAGGLYVLVGSMAGTSPGLPYQGVVLPLNMDWYLTFSLGQANQPPFANTFSFLDGAGASTASFSLPPAAVPPTLAGTTAHHAYLAFDPVTFQAAVASNPMPLTFVP